MLQHPQWDRLYLCHPTQWHNSKESASGPGTALGSGTSSRSWPYFLLPAFLPIFPPNALSHHELPISLTPVLVQLSHHILTISRWHREAGVRPCAIFLALKLAQKCFIALQHFGSDAGPAQGLLLAQGHIWIPSLDIYANDWQFHLIGSCLMFMAKPECTVLIQFNSILWGRFSARVILTCVHRKIWHCCHTITGKEKLFSSPRVGLLQSQ